MRNVQITSNDAEIDQRLAELQPYVETGLTVSVSQPGQRAMVERNTLSRWSRTTRKLCQARNCARTGLFTTEKWRSLKKNAPNTILKMPNGPQIAHFLGSNPQLVAALCNLHPLDAARHVQEISDDLARGRLPVDGDNYQAWKLARERNK
jgi:hypothetical protein